MALDVLAEVQTWIAKAATALRALPDDELVSLALKANRDAVLPLPSSVAPAPKVARKGKVRTPRARSQEGAATSSPRPTSTRPSPAQDKIRELLSQRAMTRGELNKAVGDSTSVGNALSKMRREGLVAQPSEGRGSAWSLV